MPAHSRTGRRQKSTKPAEKRTMRASGLSTMGSSRSRPSTIKRIKAMDFTARKVSKGKKAKKPKLKEVTDARLAQEIKEVTGYSYSAFHRLATWQKHDIKRSLQSKGYDTTGLNT
ncbi:MAG: hypothetical protein ABIH20_03625 [Candidatus Diapherotrites archaeon]